jgi:hypothetical protein
VTTTQTTAGDTAQRGDPERWALVVRVRDTSGDAPPGFVLVRGGEDEPLRLLDVAAPASGAAVAEVVADVVRSTLGVEPDSDAVPSLERRPRRVARWREGRIGAGWVRAVAVTVSAELDPSPPLTAVEVLPLEDAAAALTTSLDRALLHDGAALLGD